MDTTDFTTRLDSILATIPTYFDKGYAPSVKDDCLQICDNDRKRATFVRQYDGFVTELSGKTDQVREHITHSALNRTLHKFVRVVPRTRSAAEVDQLNKHLEGFLREYLRNWQAAWELLTRHPRSEFEASVIFWKATYKSLCTKVYPSAWLRLLEPDED